METPILRRDTALQGEICMDPVRQRKKLETWRNGLLDLGRRNRMMNYRRTRRGTLHITTPDFETLFAKIAGSTRAVPFKKRVDVSHDAQKAGRREP